MTNTIIIALRILAVALLGAAAYFYSAGEPDWIFASAVLAACSFFLSLRFSFKTNMAGRSSDEVEKPAETDAE